MSHDDSSVLRGALTALDENRLGDAERQFRQVLEQAPGDCRAHIGLASTLGMAGDSHGAVASYRRAIKLQPNSGGSVRTVSAVSSVNLGSTKRP